MFFNRAPGIGLDIGSKKVKLVKVNRQGNKLNITKFGSILTPPGIYEGGIIIDPEKLGERMAPLVKELGLKGKKVVSTVSGSQVYTRNIIMPRMKTLELKQATQFEATTFLPIPIEEASMDMYPLREFEDEEGKKTELFFVAVRRIQVENLQLACQIAGLKLVVVDLEPFAIYRVLGKGTEDGVEAFFNIGATRSYFCVLKKGMLLFHRFFSFGFLPFFPELNRLEEGEISPKLQLDLDGRHEFDYVINEMISELSRSVEYFVMQNREEKFNKVMLCGGGLRVKGLEDLLSAGLDYEIEPADALSHLILPSDIDEIQQDELQYDFLVALGLAAREVV